MTTYDAFRIAETSRLHFVTRSYNAYKYQFKSKTATTRQFDRLGIEQFVYQKIGRQYPTEQELIAFVMTNAAHGKTYIRDMTDGIYREAISVIESASYNIKRLLKRAWRDKRLDFNQLLTFDESTNRVPIRDEVDATIEEMAIIAVLVPWHIRYKPKIDPLGIHDQFVHIIDKYKYFIMNYPTMNLVKVREAIWSAYNNK